MLKKPDNHSTFKKLISFFQLYLLIFLIFGLLDLFINAKATELFPLDTFSLKGLCYLYLIYIGIALISFLFITFLLLLITWIKKAQLSYKVLYKVYLSLPLFFLVFIEGLYINSNFYFRLSIFHRKRLYGGLICLVIAIILSLISYYIMVRLRQRGLNKRSSSSKSPALRLIPLSILFVITIGAVIFLFALGREEGNFTIPLKLSNNKLSMKPELEIPEALPNILFISVDTLRADHLGCYGYDKVITKNIDSLAQQGVRFTNAYTAVPITLPSHASMMTGLHPLHIGCIGNKWVVKEEVTTLPEILHEKGYMTAGFISGYPLFSIFGFNQGFQYYDEQLLDCPYPFKYLYHCLPVRLMEDMRITANFSSTRQAEATTDAAVLWLKRNVKQPFFLFIHYWDPHKPLLAPARYQQKDFHPNTGWLQRLSRFIPFCYDYAYDSEVAHADCQIGRVLSTIESLKLSQKTLIIFTADHGEGLGDHKYNGHQDRLYQEQIHVPLIMIYPGHIPSKKTVSSLVRLYDIMPTILQLLNLPVPHDLDGVSLINKIYSNSEDDLVLQAGAQRQKSPPYYKLWAVVQNEWKYISYANKERNVELYNLKNDPYELLNLAGKISDKEILFNNLLMTWQQRWKKKPIKVETIDNEEALKKLKSLGYLQ